MRAAFLISLLIGFEMNALTTRSWCSPPSDQSGPGSAAAQVDENSFNYVMLGMKEHRSRLKTGVFRAYGLYTDNNGREGDLAGNVELYSVFDRPNGRARLDSSVPYRLLLTPDERGKDSSGRGWEVSYRKTKVAVTPEEVLLGTDQAGALRVLSPGQKEVRRIRGLPFDVRCLGLYYWAGFNAALPFERIYKNLTEHKPRSMSRDAEGRWKIVWDLTGALPEQRTLWIDEASGFTPLRSETRYGQREGDSIVWKEPAQTSEVTWALDKDVWVPRIFKLQEKTEDRMRSYDLSFEWETVNDRVPNILFTKEGLEIKDRTLVVDQRSGHRVVTGVLNDTPGNVSYSKTGSKGWSLVIRLILLNGIILLVLALAFLYLNYRLRRSRKATNPGAQP